MHIRFLYYQQHDSIRAIAREVAAFSVIPPANAPVRPTPSSATERVFPGPVLDRLDLHVEVPRIAYDDLAASATGAEFSAAIRERVEAAQEIQRAHSASSPTRSSAEMTPAELARSCRQDKEGQALMRAPYTRLGLSARAHSRIINLTRTIADLPGVEHIAAEQVAEVLPYWILDRAIKD